MTSKIFNKFKKEKGIYVKSSIVESFDVERFDVERFDDGSCVKRSTVERFDDGTSHSDFQRLLRNRLSAVVVGNVVGSSDVEGCVEGASVEGASVEGASVESFDVGSPSVGINRKLNYIYSFPFFVY